MRTTLVFVCVIIGALAETHLEEEKEQLHEIHEKCQANPATYADDKLLENLSQNLDNPQVQAHMLCESTKVGLQCKNGHLNIKTIKKKVALCVEDEKEVDRLVKECAIQKDTPGKTAVYLFMCLDKNGVTYFHEF
nr:odorant binding protein 21 [Monochamus saltuarius]